MYQLVDDEMEVGEIEADADGLPLGVVEVAAQEDALPLVQKTRMQIQLTVGQLQSVERLPLTHRQQPVRQRRPEPQRQIVPVIIIIINNS